MSTAPHDIEHYLEAAREIAAKISAHTDRMDAEKQIPPEIADEIKAKGLFRLLVPRSLGGAELEHPDFLKIVEVFAEADGSTAWCVNQNNVFATNSVRMPEQTAKKLYSDMRLVITNGPPTSASKAVPVDGGYRLSGHWNFSSGSRHATWLAALTPVRRPGDPELPASDRSTARVLLVPKEDARLIDTWDVVGLRGTGSFSFEIDDLFAHRFGVLGSRSQSRASFSLSCVVRSACASGNRKFAPP